MTAPHSVLRGLIMMGLLTGAPLLMAQAAFRPPDDLSFRRTDIMSEGTRLSADIYWPKAMDGKKLPCIVMSHGWGGTAAALRREAVDYSRAGYFVAVFDYRGWGTSDARVILTRPAPSEKSNGRFTAEVQEVREVVDPVDQSADLLNVLHWIQDEPQCDTDRIGLWGSSYSGGHVVWAAARDHRVKAVVSQVAGMDSRFVIAPAAKVKTYADATKRTRGELGYPAPGARVVGNLRGAPIAEKMIHYAPAEDAGLASDKCAMLFIIAEKEELFDNRDHAIKAFQKARGPKMLVNIPGITHYGIYNEARAEAAKFGIEWFNQFLK